MAGLQVSEDLNEVGGSSFQTAYSHGFGQRVSDFLLAVGRRPQLLASGPFHWVVECPHSMAAGCPRASGQTERKSKEEALVLVMI